MSEPLNYSAVTPRLGFPMLFTGQSQKEATVNEALILLDLVLGEGVLGVRNDPPTAPANGDTWIVGSLPVGEFSGHVNALAGWTEGGWRFVTPKNGWRVHDQSIGKNRLFRNSWQTAGEPVSPAGGAVVDVEARAAINALIQALRSADIFSSLV
ncbi:MAG: DUF2793 domain-containing protein [Novosphingobium sp.]|nr:DUF2793 domain-containing protein [Novosphingobium sp.]